MCTCYARNCLMYHQSQLKQTNRAADAAPGATALVLGDVMAATSEPRHSQIFRRAPGSSTCSGPCTTEIYLQLSMSLRAALASIDVNVHSTVHAATLRRSTGTFGYLHDARISKACAYQSCMAAKVQLCMRIGLHGAQMYGAFEGNR